MNVASRPRGSFRQFQPHAQTRNQHDQPLLGRSEVGRTENYWVAGGKTPDYHQRPGQRDSRREFVVSSNQPHPFLLQIGQQTQPRPRLINHLQSQRRHRDLQPRPTAPGTVSSGSQSQGVGHRGYASGSQSTQRVHR